MFWIFRYVFVKHLSSCFGYIVYGVQCGYIAWVCWYIASVVLSRVILSSRRWCCTSKDLTVSSQQASTTGAPGARIQILWNYVISLDLMFLKESACGLIVLLTLLYRRHTILDRSIPQHFSHKFSSCCQEQLQLTLTDCSSFSASDCTIAMTMSVIKLLEFEELFKCACYDQEFFLCPLVSYIQIIVYSAQHSKLYQYQNRIVYQYYTSQYYTGTILVLHWYYTGTILVLYQYYTSQYYKIVLYQLLQYQYSTSIVLLQYQYYPSITE